MKIIVVHGDNTFKSYERLKKLVDVAKSRGWQIEKIFNKNKNISEALRSKGLFESNKLVLIENFNLIRKKDFSVLNDQKEATEITTIIYHPATLTKTSIKQIKKTDKVEEYKVPKLIWSYLDSFFPGNLKTSLSILHEIVKTEAIEFVFALLSRQIRDVYWAKVEAEGLDLPSWRLGKLKRQASRFTQEKLENIISLFAKADIDAKTSKVSLIDSLDFISITQLE